MNEPIFSPANILLPKDNFDKWSVIACDQFTSRPDYWEEAKNISNGFPSTINLIFPEAFLDTANKTQTINSINSTMVKYLQDCVYNEYKDALIYVERIQSDGTLRAGIVGAVNLDEYDYNEGSTSKIRATEKTVIERIPPRVDIRRNAVTELPHVLILIDDKEKRIIESLTEMASHGNLECLYDFDLMLGGGHIKGYLIPSSMNGEICQNIASLGQNESGITLAVGDGNHSLASAKACYLEDPANISNYALVELVNIHSDAIQFEPIYRTVEKCDSTDILEKFKVFLSENGASFSNIQTENAQIIDFISKDTKETLYVTNPPHALAVGTVQIFLDEYKKGNTQIVVDYIHGENETESIATGDNACGFIYSGIKKSELFPAIAKEGVLPRKTFSMGHAQDKRYYTEVRKIRKV